MGLASLLRLLVLSALWGGSFMLMRIATPVLGPSFTAEGRVACAAVFLFFVSIHLKKPLNALRDWKPYTILGFFNSALPFFLFSYASMTLSSSEASILNATAPIWGFLIAVGLGSERLTFKRGMGLLLGFLGVVVLFSDKNFTANHNAVLAVLAGLLAAFSYGIASHYAKHLAFEPFLNAYGSMVFSTLLMLPTLYWFPPIAEPNLIVALAVMALGVLCSAVAYLLYFRLIQDLGPVSAMTVAFLIPVFGTLWGFLILNESITPNTVLGMGIVLFGTGLVTELKLREIFFPAKNPIDHGEVERTFKPNENGQ